MRFPADSAVRAPTFDTATEEFRRQIETALTPAHARLGAEAVLRLRARHAEILARISERVPDAARQEELKAQAERLNPDTWVTDGEVSAGLEGYEAVLESLRASSGRAAVAAGAVVRFGKARRRAPPQLPSTCGHGDRVRSTRRQRRRSGRRSRAGRGAGIINQCKSQIPDAFCGLAVSTLALRSAPARTRRIPPASQPASTTPPPGTTPPASRCWRAGSAAGRLPQPRRRRHDRRDRPRLAGPVHSRSEEGRVRGHRGRREAGGGFVHARARRPHDQPRGAAAAARAGRHHPAAESRPTSDASGRIFLIFVDDLHLDFRNTGRIRELFKKIAKDLIHDGDMFGIVSTGPSSLAIDMTYDRKRLDQAIEKISGAGLSPKDILETPDGSQGPPEVRYRAHVAFSTAYDIMGNLEQVHNRRKAFIYVSNGYDFNPFAGHAGWQGRGMQRCARTIGQANCSNEQRQRRREQQLVRTDDPNPFGKQGNEFADADLASELGYLTRAANRANATIYTIDPRGLVGGPDIDQEVDMMDWQNYVTESQNSLRVLAELTGGYAAVNQNDFTKALKRIDAETSDYYVVGYYSSNPDPTKKRRRIDVNVTRPT